MTDYFKDEKDSSTTPNKKIELTEADYADALNVEKDSSKISTPDPMPGGHPTEIPSAPRSRATMAMVIALLGLLGALGGVLWMHFTLSNRIGQLETLIPSGQEAASISSQNKEITSLSRQMGALEAAVSSLMAATSKPVPVAVAAPTSPSPRPSPSVATPPVKPVTVSVKVPSKQHHQGLWVINLTSLSSATAASNELSHLKRLGIHAESVKAKIRGKTWYRIRVPGFADAQKANRQREILTSKLGIHGAWIGKR